MVKYGFRLPGSAATSAFSVSEPSALSASAVIVPPPVCVVMNSKVPSARTVALPDTLPLMATVVVDGSPADNWPVTIQWLAMLTPERLPMTGAVGVSRDSSEVSPSWVWLVREAARADRPLRKSQAGKMVASMLGPFRLEHRLWSKRRPPVRNKGESQRVSIAQAVSRKLGVTGHLFLRISKKLVAAFGSCRCLRATKKPPALGGLMERLTGKRCGSFERPRDGVGPVKIVVG